LVVFLFTIITLRSLVTILRSSYDFSKVGPLIRHIRCTTSSI